MTAEKEAGGGVGLTPKQIRDGWERLFSTENPFNPVSLKAFTKIVQWAEYQHTLKAKEQP